MADFKAAATAARTELEKLLKPEPNQAFLASQPMLKNDLETALAAAIFLESYPSDIHLASVLAANVTAAKIKTDGKFPKINETLSTLRTTLYEKSPKGAMAPLEAAGIGEYLKVFEFIGGANNGSVVLDPVNDIMYMTKLRHLEFTGKDVASDVIRTGKYDAGSKNRVTEALNEAIDASDKYPAFKTNLEKVREGVSKQPLVSDITEPSLSNAYAQIDAMKNDQAPYVADYKAPSRAQKGAPNTLGV